MSFGAMLKFAMADVKRATVKDRGLLLLGGTLSVAMVYAGWYTYALGRRGPEVNILRGSNADPWENYPTTWEPKWLNYGELDTKNRPRPGPPEAWEAIGK